MSLDDLSGLSKVDRSRMLDTMAKTPDRLTPPADSAATCGHNFQGVESIVFGGVGGSGIIGEIACDFLKHEAKIPVSICRSIKLPAYVGPSTLFVGISYSGATPETLSLFDQALRKRARIVAIGSGGKLIQTAQHEKMSYLKVQEGLLPRVALPELIAAVLFLLGQAGIVDAEALLGASAEALRAQIREVGQDAPLQENRAKQMAQGLLGKLPLLLGSEDAVSVLRRFKNELNENSKMPAFYCTIPEGYHDDVEGLNTLSKLARPQPIFLRDKAETSGQRRTRERLYDLFKELGTGPVLEFEGTGEGALERLLTAITFGDYVSVYLALLVGVDPSELTLIPRFREAMRGG